MRGLELHPTAVEVSYCKTVENTLLIKFFVQRCDNIKDCQSGEDETDCKFCERDEYRCLSNDKCIPDKWRCDQYEDCPDASDELDCYYDEPTTYPTAFGSQREYPFVQVQVPNSPVNG